MLLSWQVLIAISVVTYSVGVLLHRVIVSKVARPIAFSIFSQLVSAALVLGFGLATQQLEPFSLQSVWWSLLAMAGLYGVGNIFAFLALRITEASKFTVLFASRGLVTVAVVAILLQEKTSWWQLIGAGLIFAGVVCSSWTAKQFKLQKGDYLSLAAAGCFGLANANDRFILQQVPVYTYLVLSFLLPPLVIAILNPQELKYVRQFSHQPLLSKIVLLSIFYVLATATFFAALSTATHAAQVVMTSLTSVIVIVGLSVIFLKERSHLWQKLIGALLAFLGLLLLN